MKRNVFLLAASLTALVFFFACEKEETYTFKPSKWCGSVKTKTVDTVGVDRYFITIDIGGRDRLSQHAQTVYNQFKVGDAICVDDQDNVVK